MVHFSPRAWFAAALTLLATGLSSQAAPPSDTLLPKTTTGYLAAPNLDRLASAWQRTALSQLLEHPEMKAFGEDLRQQLHEKLSNNSDRLRLSWTDVQGIATGEASIAIGHFTHGTETKPAIVVLVDIAGREEQAQATLDKLAKNLKEKGATLSTQKEGQTTLTVYDIPPAGKVRKTPWQAVHFIEGGLFVASDQLVAAKSVLARLNGQGAAEDTLAASPAYRAVIDRCRSSAGGLTPHLQWFIEPVAFVQTLHDAEVLPKKKQRSLATSKAKAAANKSKAVVSKKKDTLGIMRNQGFDSLRGIGGLLNFAEGDYGILHRTAVYAPQPFPAEKAVRMLSFPNGERLTPQDWVFQGVAGYTSFRIDIQNAFKHVGYIWDEFAEQGSFGRVLEGIKQNKDGPFDIENELVAHMGSRVTIVNDNEVPIRPTSERRLIAIETRDEAALEKSVEKALKNDRRFEKIDIAGHVVWKQKPKDEEENLNLDIQDPDDLTRDLDEEEERSEEKAAAGGANAQPAAGGPGEGNAIVDEGAICVAKGHVWFATDVRLLEKVLKGITTPEMLTNHDDYNLVVSRLESLGADKMCAMGFLRTDEQYRATYELFRAGKLPEATSLVAKALNAMLGDPKSKTPRMPKLSGEKLPDYDLVRKYLGTGGSYVAGEENGWLIVGFTLDKKPPLANGAAAGAAAVGR